jgi:ribosomal protein S6--L-glutamate ligase
MWIYKNGGGERIEEKMKQQLLDREIDTISGVDLNKAIVSNGSIFCDSYGNCNINMQESMDLYFSYNAGGQTPYQTYLYQALDKLMPTINNYNAFNLTEDKFQTSFLLKNNGIPTADYEFCHRDNHVHLETVLNKWTQLVCKPLHGWGGCNLTKIDENYDSAMLKKVLEELDLKKVYIEKFVNYDNTDYRIDIVNGQFVSCYGRKAPKGDWKTNITSGGSIFLREPNDDIVNLAINAAKITGLEIAGVDILYDREKEQYIVLEINGIPAFATPEQEAMGLDFNDKKIELIVDLIDQKTAHAS